MRRFIYFITVVSALAFILNWDASGTDAPAMDGESNHSSGNIKTGNDLRGVYYNPPEKGREGAVGRLAVLLLTEENGRRHVSLHHRFHTGESFQFIVSSNQDGWLYILHRSPGGEPQLLWPRVKSDEKMSHLDFNQVQAGQEINVPASPGKFTFDNEVGNEYFYVVIRSKRHPPELSAIEPPSNPGSEAPEETTSHPEDTETPSGSPEKNQPSRPVAGQKIVQFSVRGPRHPIRGVIYDPGPQDADPHTYFSSHPDDRSSDIVFEFQLFHER